MFRLRDLNQWFQFMWQHEVMLCEYLIHWFVNLRICKDTHDEFEIYPIWKSFQIHSLNFYINLITSFILNSLLQLQPNLFDTQNVCYLKYYRVCKSSQIQSNTKILTLWKHNISPKYLIIIFSRIQLVVEILLK